MMEHATLHAYVTILHSSLISITPILQGNLTFLFKDVIQFIVQSKIKRRFIPISFYMETTNSGLYRKIASDLKLIDDLGILSKSYLH